MDSRLQIAFEQQKKRRKPTPIHSTKTPNATRNKRSRHGVVVAPRKNNENSNKLPKKQSPSQRIGFAYEQKAIVFLQTQGLQLLAQNLSCPLGELDAVMRDGSVLVFVEIRQRRHWQYGSAIASITPAKLLRLRRAAQFFLPQLCQRHFQRRLPRCRFDAIAFEGAEEKLIWLKHIS